MDLKVYALLNAKIKELAGGGLTQAEVEKIVTDEVTKIVAGAPEDFDTLKEMSDWISSHEESAASMNSAIQTNANDISALDTNKVDKVTGKSLISDTEIARLAKVTNYNDSGIKADIQTNTDNINTNKTNILTLAKHVTGELTDSDFSEDSTAVMVKTVPTGISNYVAVKMIGGKTVKGNLFDFSSGTTSTTHKGITFTNNKDGSFTVSGTSSAGDAYIELNSASSPIPNLIKAGGSYYISNKSSSGNVRINLVPYTGSGYDTTLSGGNTPTLVTIPSNTVGLIIRIAVPKIGTEVNETVYPMISEYANSYVPYGTLSNASVESVVSKGRNLLELTGWYKRLSTTTLPYKDGDYVVVAKNESGTAEYLTKSIYIPETADYVLRFEEKVDSGILSNITYSITDEPLSTYNSSGTTWDMANSKQTIPTSVTKGKYLNVIFALISNKTGTCKFKDLKLVNSNLVSEPYTEPFKTTLLIPDSIKNLPDYGVEGNVVDFENGTYTHTNTITDGEVTALSTAETINISDILYPIRCEAGGTITLVNEHNLDVPNTIVYKKEVSLS